MGPVDDFYVWGATVGFMFFRSSRKSESIQTALEGPIDNNLFLVTTSKFHLMFL
jgi:hypothetical protein